MFTGIVEGKGKVLRMEPRGQGKALVLKVPPHLTEMQLGDSINVNGACLTVVERSGEVIKVDLSPETLEKTTVGSLREGSEVNLERALRLSDRLGGHIVTGHVDGIGSVTERRQETDFLSLRIRVPLSVAKYVVEKGSVAIDGVSLTVNKCTADEIQFTLIPYTLGRTTLLGRRVGDAVNVEADIVGKYVEKVVTQRGRSGERIDLSFLKDHGFAHDD